MVFVMVIWGRLLGTIMMMYFVYDKDKFIHDFMWNLIAESMSYHQWRSRWNEFEIRAWMNDKTL